MFPNPDFIAVFQSGTVKLTVIGLEIRPVLLLKGDVVIDQVELLHRDPPGDLLAVLTLPAGDAAPVLVGPVHAQRSPVFVLGGDSAPARGVPEGDKAVGAVGVVAPAEIGALAMVRLVEAVARFPDHVRQGGGGEGQSHQHGHKKRKDFLCHHK